MWLIQLFLESYKIQREWKSYSQTKTRKEQKNIPIKYCIREVEQRKECVKRACNIAAKFLLVYLILMTSTFCRYSKSDRHILLIDSMVWPIRSPDLNPLENFWDILIRKRIGNVHFHLIACFNNKCARIHVML